MSITTADVKKIAGLARLDIPDDRLPSFVSELNGILEHMEVLQQVNTNHLPDVPNTVEKMPLREDEVSPAPMRVSADGLTSDARDGFILVPRLSTHEDV